MNLNWSTLDCISFCFILFYHLICFLLEYFVSISLYEKFLLFFSFFLLQFRNFSCFLDHSPRLILNFFSFSPLLSFSTIFLSSSFIFHILLLFLLIILLLLLSFIFPSIPPPISFVPSLLLSHFLLTILIITPIRSSQRWYG